MLKSLFKPLRLIYFHQPHTRRLHHPTGSHSYVNQGSEFEYQTLKKLSNYNISSIQVGGKDDKGIDLRGYWSLVEKKLPIIVQCKNTKHKLGSKYVRELEGVLINEKNQTIGMLVANSGFSTICVNKVLNSPLPLVLVKIVDLGIEYTVEMLVMNNKTKKLFDNKLTVSMVYSQGSDNHMDKVVLLYDNKVIGKS